MIKVYLKEAMYGFQAGTELDYLEVSIPGCWAGVQNGVIYEFPYRSAGLVVRPKPKSK